MLHRPSRIPIRHEVPRFGFVPSPEIRILRKSVARDKVDRTGVTWVEPIGPSNVGWVGGHHGIQEHVNVLVYGAGPVLFCGEIEQPLQKTGPAENFGVARFVFDAQGEGFNDAGRVIWGFDEAVVHDVKGAAVGEEAGQGDCGNGGVETWVCCGRRGGESELEEVYAFGHFL